MFSRPCCFLVLITNCMDNVADRATSADHATVKIIKASVKKFT